MTLANNEYTYSGSAITPEVTVKGTVQNDNTGDSGTGTGDGSDTGNAGAQTGDTETGGENGSGDSGADTSQEVTLVQGTDYTVKYDNNTNAGEASVTVEGH